MLIKTKEILAAIESQALETEPVASLSQTPGISPGYVKYGLYSRKAIFFHAYYKAFDLEGFKANKANAQILAEIFSNLLLYFLPNPSEWYVITTPKRAHTERLGYHFSSEVLKIVSEQTGIKFLQDIVGARDKNKIEPVFFQLNPIPPGARLILYDDILTTGKTIYTTLDVLKSNPQNKLAQVNIPVIVGINNN